MKNTFFNTKEVLTIANNIEEDGIMFYKLMSERTSDPEIKNVFMKFADDEVEHKHNFERILKNPGVELFDLEEESIFSKYLAEIVETGVFPGNEKEYPDIAKGKDEMQAAIKIGMAAELKSVVFYKKAADACINDDGRKAFIKLMAIEQEHYHTLEKLYEKISHNS